MRRRAQPWLGTLVEISVDHQTPEQAVTAAFGEIARLHRLMSFHDPASDISRFNRAAPGALLRIDPATWEVLQLALALSAASQGLFDVACAPWLVRRTILPAPAEEPTAPSVLASDQVFTLEDDSFVRKLAPGWIDLGGIAKGFIVDAAVAHLQRSGASAGCVNGGGDLRAFGEVAVPVAVRAPDAPARAARHIMLSNEALATSGSYFSSRWHAGESVCALLDGRDGRFLNGPGSASVRAARCAVADAFTKIVLASGDAFHPALAAWGATAFFT